MHFLGLVAFYLASGVKKTIKHTAPYRTPYNGIIYWFIPLPSSSHHQDYSICSRESQPKPSFATGILGGAEYPNYIEYDKDNLSPPSRWTQIPLGFLQMFLFFVSYLPKLGVKKTLQFGLRFCSNWVAQPSSVIYNPLSLAHLYGICRTFPKHAPLSWSWDLTNVGPTKSWRLLVPGTEQGCHVSRYTSRSFAPFFELKNPGCLADM